MAFVLLRKSTAPDTGTGVADPNSGVVRLPATNMYQDMTNMDLYAYLSHLEILNKEEFPTQLLWKKTGLVYGDWTAGPSGDGCFSESLQFPTTEVRCYLQ